MEVAGDLHQILVKLEGLGESCLVLFFQTQDETFPFLKSCPGVNGMGQFSHNEFCQYLLRFPVGGKVPSQSEKKRITGAGAKCLVP